MAQRKARQRKTQPPDKAQAEIAERREPSDIAGWRLECDRLRRELAAAREEIAQLRARQEQVLNRIDWVLDSLDSLTKEDS